MAHVSFIEGFPGVAMPRLRDGSLDFVVAVVVPEHLAPEFDHIELYESRSVIVGHANHPLKDCTRLAELSDAKCLLNPLHESATQALLDSYASRGLAVPARVIAELRYRARLAARLRCTRIDARIAARALVSRRRAVRVACRQFATAVSVCVVTRRDSPLTPAATLLLDCLRHAARDR